MPTDLLAGMSDNTSHKPRDLLASAPIQKQKSENEQALENLDAFLIGGGRGIQDVVQGGEQLGRQGQEAIDKMLPESALNAIKFIRRTSGIPEEANAEQYRQEVNKELENYASIPQVKENPGYAFAGRIAGNVGATAPIAALNVPRAIGGLAIPAAARFMGSGALQGGTAGALQYDETGQNRLSNTLLGGAIGGAVPAGFLGGKATISAFKKKPIELAEEAASEAKTRLDDFKKLGIENPTAGAITRDPTIQAQEELLVKGSDNKAAGEMRTAYENVEKQIYQAAQKMVNTLGGKAKNSVDIGQEIKDVSGNIYRENNKKVSDLYDIAKNAEGADFAINKQPILDAYKQIQSDFIDVKFSPSVRNTMELLSSENAKLNINQAIKLTKRLNASAENASSYADKKAIGILKEKVYDQIDALADLDIPSAKLFNIAKQSRKELGSTFNQRDIVELIRKKKAQYTDYIDPEKVVSRINTLKDWDKIEQALTYKGVKGADGVEEIADPAGIEAYNNLRTTKLNDFFEDSSVDVNGQMQLSLPKLTKNYEKISEPVMRKIIGNDDVFNDFNTLVRVMNYWKNKAPGTVNTSNSANAINRMAVRGLNTLSSIPLVGEGLFLIKKVFEDAKDAKWVQQNLAIGKGKIEATAKKQKKEPTFAANIARLAAPIAATQP